MQESLNARIGEAQCRRALFVYVDGSLHVLEASFADETVVTDALVVEQTSVGRKADLAQFLEIFDASADGEVAGIVDRCFGSQSLSLCGTTSTLRARPSKFRSLSIPPIASPSQSDSGGTANSARDL